MERLVVRPTASGRPGVVPVTLSRFLGREAALSWPTRKPASRAARRLALLAALENGVPGIRVPEAGPARVALAASLDRTLGALAESGCSVEALEATRTARGRGAAQVARTQRELLEAAGLHDARLLAHALPVAGAFEHVVFRGFADLPASTLALATRLHRDSRKAGGRGVAFALPRLEGALPAGVPDAVSDIAATLERFFAEAEDAPEIEWDELDGRADVELVEAAHRGAEARAVAAAVSRALDAGASLDRIAVVVPDGDASALDALRAALEDASIPFSEPRGRSAAGAPEARALVALASMASSRIDRREVVEVLRTPGLHAGTWVESTSEREALGRAALLARRFRELPISADRDGRLFIAAARALSKGPDEAWIAQAAEKIAGDVIRLRGASTRTAITTRLAELAHRLRLGEPSAGELGAALRAEAAGGAGFALAAMAEGSAALRAVTVALDEMADAALALGVAAAPARLEEVAAELALELEMAPTAARGGGARAGAARVGSLLDVAGIEHDLVVFSGMSESSSREAPGEGWLDDETISRLPPSMRPRTRDDLSRVTLARMAWSVGLTRRAVFSRSLADDEGREAEPAHPLFSRLVESGHPVAREPASRVSRSASAVTSRARDLVALAAGAPPPPDLFARVAVEHERTRFFLEPNLTAGAFTGRITRDASPRLAERFGGRRPDRSISVSTIERAAGCAFRAFSERVLGARRFEEVSDTPTGRERGILLHDALHVAFETNLALPPSVEIAERLVRVEAVLADELELGAEVSPLVRESRALAIRDALAVLEARLIEPSPVAYAEGERRFAVGRPPPWGPLELVGPAGEPVFVDGQIDRIDRSTDALRVEVIDYKTGKAPPWKGVGTSAFQLPLYASVAARVWPDAEIAAAYVSVAPGGEASTSPRKPSDALFPADRLAEIEARSAAIVTRLWSGEIAPRPSSPRQCIRCAARDLCRRPAVMPRSDDSADTAPAKPRVEDEA